MRQTAEVAILSGVVRDFYVAAQLDDRDAASFLGGRPGAPEAYMRAHVNPLTWFVWVGSLILFGGTALALWPSSRGEKGTDWGTGLRRARSFALLSLVFVALVAAFDSAAQGALVAAGAVLVAALWAGGLAVHAGTAGGKAGKSHGDGEDAGGGSVERVESEIEVEKMMGRWGDE